MVNHNFEDQEIEPQLSELFDLIKDVPPRDDHMVQRRRLEYLSAVDTLVKADKQTFLSWLAGLFTIPKTGMRRSTQFANSALLVIIAITIVLLSGFGATAYAAQNALPGDVLYQVKTGLEQVQVNLTSDAAEQAQLHLRLAERRLDEILSLIKDGRYREIQHVAEQFEYHVQQAIQAMNILTRSNPEQANALSAQIADALSRYGLMLTEMIGNLPEDIQPSLRRAIEFSQDPDDGEHGSINGNINQNHNGDDNDNTNENGNQNDDGNQNGNSNGTGNENGEVENENLNENRNENLNENHNGNINQNENEYDNSNENDGANQNVNDSNENNENGNSNDGNDNENRGSNNNNNNNDNNNDNDNDNVNDNSNGGDD